jgi:hypothetical protein
MLHSPDDAVVILVEPDDAECAARMRFEVAQVLT